MSEGTVCHILCQSDSLFSLFYCSTDVIRYATLEYKVNSITLKPRIKPKHEDNTKSCVQTSKKPPSLSLSLPLALTQASTNGSIG